MAGVSGGVKSWLLDKYAKFVAVRNVLDGPSVSSTDTTGEWKQYSSLEGQGSLQVTLIEDKHLMLTSGTQIHESYALVNASHWLRAVCKGDSVLFLLNVNNEIKRFRVRFANTGVKTGWDNCHDFINAVSSLFAVKEIPISESVMGSVSQSQLVDDSQLFSTPPFNTPSFQSTQEAAFASSSRSIGEGSTIPEIAKQILSRDHGQSGGSFLTNHPTADLPTLVRLCLTDPSFPDFVEKVEQEIKVLTSQN